ncbi:MAG: hypothetical protein CMJ31_09945 [Phycisphaerae bacterium]|nr:hypothetical protein [Phycisphaerae bacterium]
MTGEEWISVEQTGDNAVVLAPSADIDMSRSPEFRAAIQEAFRTRGVTRVVIDLDGVGYMDSSGLATLVEAMRTSKSQSTPMVLCGMNERVRAIFEIARLHQFFTITDTRDAAMST